MGLQAFIARVKRREGPLERFVYDVGKGIRSLEMPAPRAVYGPLLHAHQGVANGVQQMLRMFYYQPLFRSRCDSVGRRLELYAEMPDVRGDLRLVLGSNCRINGAIQFNGGDVCGAPMLRIDDHTYVGYAVIVDVCRSVSIGKHVLIADRVIIRDNPGYAVDPMHRRRGEMTPDQVKPVVIEDDVWIGAGSTVTPGVTIGRCSVVGASSVVTESLPPYSLAVGNPAKVVRTLDPSEFDESSRAQLAAAAES